MVFEYMPYLDKNKCFQLVYLVHPEGLKPNCSAKSPSTVTILEKQIILSFPKDVKITFFKNWQTKNSYMSFPWKSSKPGKS
jgi:hypothetical protein